MTAAVVRFLMLLAIFASVFLIVQLILRVSIEKGVYVTAVNKRLQLIAKGFDREEIMSRLRRNDPAFMRAGPGLLSSWLVSLHKKLLMAGLPFGATQIFFAMVFIFAGLVLAVSLGAYLFNYQLNASVFLIIFAFAGAVAIAIPLIAVNFLAQRRRKRMQEQFPIALDVFVRALRSGHPVASAIELLTQEMEDPIGSEFGMVSDEVSYGAQLTDSLQSMAERWDMDDLRMFVVSLSVQSETGGNLAEILENLSKVIRERSALYLKVRALSSEGRMTGWMLTVLPIFAFVSLFAINPGFYLNVARDPIFFIGFPALILWYLVGVLMIRKLVNFEV